jgi:cytochrome P450
MSQSYAPVFSPEFLVNPHPTYDYLRAHSPVCFLEDVNGWVITSYKDVVSILKDRRFSNAVGSNPVIQRNIPLFTIFQDNALVYTDQPDHMRLRALMHKSFSPQIVKKLQDSVLGLVTQLLDTMDGRDEIDFINDFAYPLPTTLIAELVGVPPEERYLFMKFSKGIIEGFDINATPEKQKECNNVFKEFREYSLSLAAEKRKDPQDDLASILVEAYDAGTITEEELINNCIILLTAGHETLTSLLTNGMFTLLQHPDQLDMLKNDPALISTAIEEMMRYSRSLQMVLRVVKEDVEVNGQLMKKGQNVVVFLSAANRDPEVFPDPNRFDITRTPNPHVGFGYGIHHCLGAPLARVEAPVALTEFLKKYPNAQLSPEPLERVVALRNQTLKKLPVVLNASQMVAQA